MVLTDYEPYSCLIPTGNRSLACKERIEYVVNCYSMVKLRVTPRNANVVNAASAGYWLSVMPLQRQHCTILFTIHNHSLFVSIEIEYNFLFNNFGLKVSFETEKILRLGNTLFN